MQADNSERLKLMVERLRTVASSPIKLGVSMERLSEIDGYLRDTWGIQFVATVDEMLARMEKSAGRDARKRWERLHADLLLEAREDGTNTAAGRKIEAIMIDMVAQPGVTGPYHSIKRAFILDALVFVHAVLELFEPRGLVVDLGCQTGHHVIALAKHFPAKFLGIDRNEACIRLAQQKATGVGNISLLASDYAKRPAVGPAQIMYCLDAWPRDTGSLGGLIDWVSKELADGGLFILGGNIHGWISESWFNRRIIAAGLGYVLHDLVGGWITEEEGFKSKEILILAKGWPGTIPAALWKQGGEWPEFANWVNSTDPPRDQTSQAYHRATLRHH